VRERLLTFFAVAVRGAGAVAGVLGAVAAPPVVVVRRAVRTPDAEADLAVALGEHDRETPAVYDRPRRRPVVYFAPPARYSSTII